MLNDVAKEWVKALRSGDYKQGIHSLHNLDDSFCCLGVLCDLAVEAGVARESKSGKEIGYEADGFYASLLPPSVAKWAGLRTRQGNSFAHSLVYLNDDGRPFTEIADVIESDPEGMFGEYLGSNDGL